MMYGNESAAGAADDTPTHDHLTLLIVLYIFVSIVGIVGKCVTSLMY